MSLQVLYNTGTAGTQTSQTLTPQDSADLVVFLTSDQGVNAPTPSGWSGTSGYFTRVSSGSAPLYASATSGEEWANIIASFTARSGTPTLVQNWGGSSGAWGSGSVLGGTSGVSTTAGNTIFVNLQGSLNPFAPPPTVTDSHGNIYQTFAVTNPVSGVAFGCYLYVATNKTSGLLTVNLTSGTLMASAIFNIKEWSGITSASAPTVISINPTSGSNVGGTPVTITGTNFVATPTVHFGSNLATSVVWVNATTLTCVAPAGAAGVVTVTVTNPDRQVGTLLLAYTYVPAYKSSEGFTCSAIKHGSDSSPDNLTVTGFLEADGINEHDVRAHLYDNATVELRAVNWADLTMGSIKLLGGTVGDITLHNGSYEMELRGLTQLLSTQIGSTFSGLCRAELFGGGASAVPIDVRNHWKCRLNRDLWVQDGAVGSSPDSITIVPAGSLLMVGSTTPTVAAPAGWFNDGLITFSSGVLSGYSFEIASWDGTNISLFGGAPMPFAPSPSDGFDIEPGCDKTIGTCSSKFGNAANHAGESAIPGLLQIGALSNSQLVG